MSYIGRFAPSPTGALHAGSLVTALASWLDARAHRGQWLVRMEDVDIPRCVPGAAQEIMRQLTACGLLPDEAPVYQSSRSALYQTALDALMAQKAVYPCACSRKDIEEALESFGTAKPRHGELVYPGTCRDGLGGKSARAWRFKIPNFKKKKAIAAEYISEFAINTEVNWADRRLGAQQQDVAQAVGDFVLRRADGLWAYQLAVVIDDAAQGITHVVRGEDLADNTARQILLQRALDYTTPAYLHTALVYAGDGQKLSKQTGARALALSTEQQALEALQAAAAMLSLPTAQATSVSEALNFWVQAWPFKMTA